MKEFENRYKEYINKLCNYIKNNEENNDEEIETKESKIKKILDLSKKTKNADKFDEALKNQKINVDENEEMKEKDNGNENIENMH